MKKYYYLFATLLVCLPIACNKVNEQEENPQTPTITYIKAEGNEEATKASIDDDDATFTWNTNDRIAVWADGYKISDPLASTYDATNSATFSFSGDNVVIEDERANFAIFPASLVYDGSGDLYTTDVTASSLKLNLPASYSLAQVQDEVSPTPMIATNERNGNLAFKALCPLLRITVVNIPKQTQSIEFDFNGNKVQGEFTLTGVVPGTTEIATGATDGTDDIITVTMAGNNTWHDNLVINLPVPTGTYGNITITAKDEAGLPVLTLTKAIKAAGWTPTRKSSRKMTATLPVFSVSATKKVTFAPGNLQYQASTRTWRFAEHQYNVVGDDTYGNVYVDAQKSTHSQMAENYTGWIDMFGWGTSGWPNSGDGSSGVASWINYQPWSTEYMIDHSTEYPNNKFEYGPDHNPESTTGLMGVYRKGDWGVYNSISGYPADTWRLPTMEEMVYAIGTTNGETIEGPDLVGLANVSGINGIIILPDTFSDPMKNNGKDAFAKYGTVLPKAFSNNVYSSGDWALMDAAGAVFFPCSGVRREKTFTNIDIQGFYWWTASTNNAQAYVMRFGSSYYYTNYSMNRCYGGMVRLLRELN